ncbi:MAG: hypothetical protein U1E97_01520 [Alphaproteobacteria bacterium]
MSDTPQSMISDQVAFDTTSANSNPALIEEFAQNTGALRRAHGAGSQPGRRQGHLLRQAWSLDGPRYQRRDTVDVAGGGPALGRRSLRRS